MTYCENYQKRDTKTQSEQMLLGMVPIDLLDLGLPQTFILFFFKNKSQLSVKHSKVEHDKMRYDYALETQYDIYPVWAKLCTFQ